MKRLKSLIFVLFLMFSLSFLVACSDESSYKNSLNLNDYNELTTEGEIPDGTRPEAEMPDGNLPEGEIPDGTRPEGETPDGTLPEGKTPDGAEENENSNLGYQELLKTILEKYYTLKEEAFEMYKTSLESKKLEILGDQYAQKILELEQLKEEYNNLYNQYLENNDLPLIKEQLLALSMELSNYEFGSPEYLAKVEELKSLWNQVSLKVDEVSVQLNELNSRMYVLKQELRVLYEAKKYEIMEAKRTLSSEFYNELQSIKTAMELEIKSLNELYGIDGYLSRFGDYYNNFQTRMYDGFNDLVNDNCNNYR